MSAASNRQRSRAPRYRRRRPIPALILLALLVVVSGFVWTRVFETRETVELATRCNLPTAHTSGKTTKPPAPPEKTVAGTMLARDALNDTVPIPPQDVHVQVVNANGKVNQATLISKKLDKLGYATAGSPANDPVYSNLDMQCHAQIRFGRAGAGAARTLSLLMPCAQLVRDERTSAEIEVALGAQFDDINRTQEAQQVLQQLKIWGKQHDPKKGDQDRTLPPEVDEDKLADARDVHC